MSSVLQLLRRRAFINALVTGMKFNYEEHDYAPKLAGNTIYMPTFKAGMTKQEELQWMEALITLCYSALPENRPDLEMIKEHSIDMDSNLGKIYNLVCKHNHQLARNGMLIGADEYVRNSYDLFISSVNFSEQTPEAQALLMLDVIGRMGWMTDTDYGLPYQLSPEGRELFKKLAPVYDEYEKLRTAGHSNYILAKTIHDILFEDEQEEEEDAQQQEPENGEDGEGEGDENSEAAGESGEENDGEGEGEVAEKETKAGGESKPFDGIKASEIGYNQVNSDILPKNTSGFKAMPNTDIDATKFDHHTSTGGHRYKNAKACVTETLSTKVRNMLKVMSQAHYRGGHKRGKINKRAIASITSGNERIFRQKEMKDVIDTCVMLLVDCSGSMSGDRYTHAIAATSMLVDCLTKLHIPCEVQGFTFLHDYDEGNVQYIFKRFSEYNCSGEDILSRMSSEDVRLTGNSDAESLLRGYEEVVRQKQKRKIMIVLSDGEPADGYYISGEACPHTNLLKVCNDIEKNKQVELYGIGIQTNAVQKYYKKYVVVNSTHQLESKLLEVLKQSII